MRRAALSIIVMAVAFAAWNMVSLMVPDPVPPTEHGAAVAPPDASREVFRVTTFNILHDQVRGLSPAWRERRAHVVRIIREIDPDVICLQEVSARQLEQLREDLPGYDVIEGDTGGPIVVPVWLGIIAKPAHWALGDYFDGGEFCPIFVRRSSFRLVANGHLHLPSPRPTRAFTPHILNWARVESLRSGTVFEVFNTHLGILPWREKRSATDLLEAINGIRSDHAQILTGDFNSRPRGALLRVLTAHDDGAGFQDSWWVAAHRVGTGATFNWGLGLPGPRIDYVLTRPGMRVREAIVSGPGMPTRPSDHWAFTAELELGAIAPGR
jgi:endonuclease/exonuclease/phosphatase family metal-dependent hydrolase